MADFFSKVKESLNKGTTIVSAKSSTLIETNKVKAEISGFEREKSAAITEIGTQIYEMKKAGYIQVEQVEPILEKIFELDQKIAEKELEKQEILRKEEEALKAVNTPVAPVALTAPVQAAPTTIVCTCGAVLAADAKFCGSCGQKTEELVRPVVQVVTPVEVVQVQEVTPVQVVTSVQVVEISPEVAVDDEENQG